MSKSAEHDIRAAVVSNLLADGYSREQIRLEIPLDTASCEGRGDVVLLNDWLNCIELKSGKDKYHPDDIKTQRNRYSRAFDAVITCVDRIHFRCEEIEAYGCKQLRNNWYGVDIQYCHEARQLQKACYWSSGEDRKPLSGKGVDVLLNSKRCPKISIYDVASLLWAEEAKAILGNNTTKCGFVRYMREYGKLSELRPLVISALKKRPLNKWEAAFWAKFDAEARA